MLTVLGWLTLPIHCWLIQFMCWVTISYESICTWCFVLSNVHRSQCCERDETDRYPVSENIFASVWWPHRLCKRSPTDDVSNISFSDGRIWLLCAQPNSWTKPLWQSWRIQLALIPDGKSHRPIYLIRRAINVYPTHKLFTLSIDWYLTVCGHSYERVCHQWSMQ